MVAEIEQLEKLRERLIHERRSIIRTWNAQPDDPLIAAERVQQVHVLLKTIEEAIEHEKSLRPATARQGI